LAKNGAFGGQVLTVVYTERADGTELSRPAGQHDMSKSTTIVKMRRDRTLVRVKPSGTEVVISVEPLARITPEEAACRDPDSEGVHRALQRGPG
jgi:hypothetical protein